MFTAALFTIDKKNGKNPMHTTGLNEETKYGTQKKVRVVAILPSDKMDDTKNSTKRQKGHYIIKGSIHQESIS